MSHFSLQQSAFLPSNHQLHCIASTNYYEVGFGSRLSTFWWRWKTNRWWSMNRFSGEIFTHGFLIVFKEKKWERKCWDDHLSPPAVIFIVCHVKLWQSNDVLELYFFLLKSVGIHLVFFELISLEKSVYATQDWLALWIINLASSGLMDVSCCTFYLQFTQNISMFLWLFTLFSVNNLIEISNSFFLRKQKKVMMKTKERMFGEKQLHQISATW